MAELPVVIRSVDELRSLIGSSIGPTPWRTVTQEDIDTFARLTGDDQWIHVDVERARRESPYGMTIAHGNLTLSLIDGMRRLLLRFEGAMLGVNYGWNKVRFPAPVPAGGRIRGSAEPIEVTELGDGWHHLVTRFTIEVEGGEKPACVGDSVGRMLLPAR